MKIHILKSKKQSQHMRTSKTGKVYSAGIGQKKPKTFNDILEEKIKQKYPSAILEEYQPSEPDVGISNDLAIIVVNKNDFDKIKEGQRIKIDKYTQFTVDKKEKEDNKYIVELS